MCKTSRSVTPRVYSANSGGERGSADVLVLRIDGPLHGSLGADLRHKIEALLHRGARKIVLCLAGAATIDAAGVGELVRAHNMVAAANGVLRVTNTSDHITTLLTRVGLLELLTGDAFFDL